MKNANGEISLHSKAFWKGRGMESKRQVRAGGAGTGKETSGQLQLDLEFVQDIQMNLSYTNLEFKGEIWEINVLESLIYAYIWS